MTFVVRGEILVDGDKAKAEVKGVDDAVKKATGSAEKFSRAGRGAAKDTTSLGNEAKFAAGSVSNLTAQFNDVGVMLAAGQNPLQLAIQQGTQITQVFGNAGAAQAAGMLKQAFIGMINPLNLVTIGGLAAGAALVQWGIAAFGASEDANTLTERLKAAGEAQASLTEEVRRARLGVTEEELALLDNMAAKKKEIADLESEISAGLQRGRQNAPRELQIAQQELAALKAQLATIRNLQDEKDTQLSQAAELADQERLLGQQMQVTNQQLAENEGIADLLKKGISASVIEAMQLAGVDMASPISAAAQDAALLATNLGIAYGEAVKLNYERSRTYVSSGRGGNPADFVPGGKLHGRYVPSPEAILGANNLLNPPKPKTRGSSAARAAQREQKAIDDLIASQKRQLDLLREHDPIQKEMIENRRILEKATEAERKAVEKLIGQRIAEEARIEAATESAEAFRDITYDALDGLILRGEKGADVIANLADALANAALQSALLGTGPLSGLFGTSDSGGLLGAIGSFLFPDAKKNADGGMQYGPGGPRDDLMPSWISPGEYIVNAAATAKNRGVLEYINAGGQVAAFAQGGIAQAGPRAMTPVLAQQQGGASGRVVIELRPTREFDARVLQTAQGVAVETVDQYRSSMLAGDIENYSNDPSRRG